MLQSLAILGSYRHLASDGLSIHVQRHLLPSVLVRFDVDHLSLVRVLEDDVNVDRGREEVRHLARLAVSKTLSFFHHLPPGSNTQGSACVVWPRPRRSVCGVFRTLHLTHHRSSVHLAVRLRGWSEHVTPQTLLFDRLIRYEVQYSYVIGAAIFKSLSCIAKATCNHLSSFHHALFHNAASPLGLCRYSTTPPPWPANPVLTHASSKPPS